MPPMNTLIPLMLPLKGVSVPEAEPPFNGRMLKLLKETATSLGVEIDSWKDPDDFAEKMMAKGPDIDIDDACVRWIGDFKGINIETSIYSRCCFKTKSKEEHIKAVSMGSMALCNNITNICFEMLNPYGRYNKKPGKLSPEQVKRHALVKSMEEKTRLLYKDIDKLIKKRKKDRKGDDEALQQYSMEAEEECYFDSISILPPSELFTEEEIDYYEEILCDDIKMYNQSYGACGETYIFTPDDAKPENLAATIKGVWNYLEDHMKTKKALRNMLGDESELETEEDNAEEDEEQ